MGRSSPSTPPREERVTLCGVGVDAVDLRGAVQRVLGWVDQPGDRCRVVVTPNVHHAVLAREHPAFRDVYAQADLALPDGAPLVALARGVGRPLPARVPGSDLVPALFAAAAPGLRVFLLGAGPGVGERAAAQVRLRWPGVDVVGVASPPPGFERDGALDQALVDQVNRSRAQVLVVGLGAPKQELWVHRHREVLRASVALCVGATIDFLAGRVKRAPLWVQRSGFEWAYRVAQEPRRLFGRYAHDAPVFARLALADVLRARGGTSRGGPPPQPRPAEAPTTNGWPEAPRVGAGAREGSGHPGTPARR